MVVPAPATVPPATPEKDNAESVASKAHDDLLSDAVARARTARRTGVGDSTVVIMREMLDKALHRTSRKFKVAITVLVCALVGVSAYGYWKIRGSKVKNGRLTARSSRSKPCWRGEMRTPPKPTS